MEEIIDSNQLNYSRYGLNNSINYYANARDIFVFSRLDLDAGLTLNYATKDFLMHITVSIAVALV